MCNIIETISRMNKDLEATNLWARNNSIGINAKKLHGIIVNKRQFQTDGLPSLSINGETITCCSKVKNLGVIMNQTMTWKDYKNGIIANVFNRLRTLRTLKHITPAYIKLLLVKSLLIPHFTYCDVLFGHTGYAQNAHMSNDFRRLTIAFNACVRNVHILRKYDHTSHLHNALLQYSLKDLYRLHTSVFTFKIWKTKIPPYLNKNLCFGRSTRLGIFTQ